MSLLGACGDVVNQLCYHHDIRQVLVNLMGMPERLDWKACMLSEEEDKADAQGFKAAFAPFDTTT